MQYNNTTPADIDIRQVWQDYRHELQRFLQSRVNSPEDVEDLLQDIMIKTYQKLHTVKDAKKLRGWLYQVTRNAITDYYRQSYKHQIDTSAIIETAPEPEKEEHVLQELSSCITPFVNQLPGTYQEAVEAVDLKGVSQKALSKELSLPYSTVKSRVQRGRQMLADLYQQCCRFEIDARGNIMDYEKNGGCCP